MTVCFQDVRVKRDKILSRVRQDINKAVNRLRGHAAADAKRRNPEATLAEAIIAAKQQQIAAKPILRKPEATDEENPIEMQEKASTTSSKDIEVAGRKSVSFAQHALQLTYEQETLQADNRAGGGVEGGGGSGGDHIRSGGDRGGSDSSC